MALLAAGIVSGLLAGLLGIGGGAVIVPVLYQAFSLVQVDPTVQTHLAIGTSLCIIIPTSLRSFMKHRAKGAVEEGIIRSWAIFVVAGSCLGAAVAWTVSGEFLRLVFAVFAFVMAMQILLMGKNWVLTTKLPPQPWWGAIGAFIGLFSSLMGIGGGIFGNTVLSLCGRPIHKAVATSSGLGVLISIPGALGYVLVGWSQMDKLPILSLGYVHIVGVMLIMPLSVLTAPLGVKLAHLLSPSLLSRSFAVFLLFVSARFVISLI